MAKIVLDDDELAATMRTNMNNMFTELYQVYVGKSGGQTIVGSTLTDEDLNLRSNAADLVTGSVNILDTLEAADVDTAALTTAGGLAVKKSLRATNGYLVTPTNTAGSIATIDGTQTLSDKLLRPRAGTIAALTAPLKFTSGPLLTTAEAGTLEFLTDKLYFGQTTGPTRREIQLYDTQFAEMKTYENTNAIVVPVANQYIAIQGSGIVTGIKHGFTFDAGVTGAIASVADYTGIVAGTVLVTVAAGHNLLTGDYVTIYNTTNYNGRFIVTKISATEYYITAAWVATNTGNYARGVRLVAGTGVAGVYKVSMSMTAISAVANKIIKFEICQNAELPENIVASRAFAGTDYGSLASSGFLQVADGDHIWAALRNETSGTNVTIRHLNINMNRV